MSLRFVLLALAVLLEACTTPVNLRPEIGAPSSVTKAPLTVGIYLDPTEREKIVAQQFIVLGMTEWKFPVGHTLESVSLTTLSHVFQSVALTSNPADPQYDLIFEPRVRSFDTSYLLNGVSTKMSVHFSLRSTRTSDVQEGVLSGEGNRKGGQSMATTPHEILSRVGEAAFEMVAADLMQQLQRSTVVAKLKSAPATEKAIVAAPAAAPVAKAAVPVPAVLSDVDAVPARAKDFSRSDTYAIVIGISNYREEVIPKVRYASRDAEIVAKYLENVGGIPRANIKVLLDERATLSDFQAYFGDWLTRRVKETSSVVVYYAGHGAPDVETNQAFLVPYDAHPDFTGKMYPLKTLYDSLGKLPSKDIVVMLDSCFSGAGGRSVTKPGARPVVLAVENPLLATEKAVVMTASTGSQISSDYDKAQHGLFTYYLLKGLRGEGDKNRNGFVEIGELYDYVSARVSETASLELNRDQSPVMQPAVQALGSRLTQPFTKVSR